jgi:hypothetical protein
VIVVQSVPATRRENVLSRHHDRESTAADVLRRFNAPGGVATTMAQPVAVEG